MIDLWNRLESYLQANAPSVLATLLPPATDAQIARAETALGVRLPPDLAASLEIHNGQVQETGRGEAIPLVPQEFDRRGESIASWGELAPLELIIRSTEIGRQFLSAGAATAADFGGDEDDVFEFRGPVRHDGKWNFINFIDSGTGDVLAVDLAPGKGGAIGQVVSIANDPPALIVLAAGYREWFELLVDRYEAGRYFYGQQDGELTALDRWNPEL